MLYICPMSEKENELTMFADLETPHAEGKKKNPLIGIFVDYILPAYKITKDMALWYAIYKILF